MNLDKKIILFDGTCNFCGYWVKYVVKRDKKDVFYFAALQSEIGKKYLTKYKIDVLIDSIILIEKDNFYVKSTAALRIIKNLGGATAIWYVLIIVPVFIRDFCYDVVAKYRKQWFGNRKCEFVPHQNTKNKFLM